MGNIRKQLGTEPTALTANLSVSETFETLKAGLPVYIASSPETTDEMRLRGAWRDTDGDIHYDWACAYLAKDTALQVGKAFQQQCILALTPNRKAKGRVYLMPDSIRNRVCALRYAGGYTADGFSLITAVVDAEPIPFEVLGEVQSIPCKVEFIPCE
jgi:hypothetical protein